MVASVEFETGPVFRLSTDDFPAAQRVARWREDYGRKMFRLEFEPLGDQPFHAGATVHPLPDIEIVQGRSSPLHIRRSRELLSDGDDGLILQIADSPFQAAQLGRQYELSANQAILLSCADTGSITEPMTPRIMALRLRRLPLAARVCDLGAGLMQPIPQENEALRLLRQYIGLLVEGWPIATPTLRRAATGHIYDLLAVAIGARPDAAEAARLGGLRAARLQAIKAQVVDNLHRSEFAVGDVAARHGITPRSVQLLFEAEGTTFTQFLLEQRLARAHHALTDPALAGRSITGLAYDVGFNDLSYFNRTFRRRFGATPSEIRAARYSGPRASARSAASTQGQ